MPRTALTKTLVPTEIGITAGTAMTFTAADVANLNSVPLTGLEIVIAYNADGVSHNVTISSAPDAKGRKSDITADPVAAGIYKVYCRHSIDGWRQPDGNLYLQADSALVK